MCFSAATSFGLSVVLVATSVITLKRVQKPSQFPFAVIPLIFAIQQFSEGILWLTFTNSAYTDWNYSTTLFFLVFAQVIWPFWVPYSMFLLEIVPIRKKIYIVLIIMGGLTAIYRAYSLINFPVYSDINDHHIRYIIDFNPKYIGLSLAFYFIPIVIPAFVSSVKHMVLIGYFLLISFIITMLFYSEFIISVWCYYAAAISMVIILISSTFLVYPKSFKK